MTSPSTPARCSEWYQVSAWLTSAGCMPSASTPTVDIEANNSSRIFLRSVSGQLITSRPRTLSTSNAT